MSQSWGTNFVIVNDIHQQLSPDYPGWEHWATIKRGLDEYIVFHCNPGPKHALSKGYAGRVYIEKIVRHRVNIELVQIQDANEFEDITAFAEAAGLLTRDTNTELKVGYWWNDQVGYGN